MRKHALPVINTLPIFLVVLTLASCSKPTEGDAWSLQPSEITFISSPTFDCGVVFTLAEVKLKDARNIQETIYLPCGHEHEEPLPSIGTLCSGIGKFETVNGIAGSKSLQDLPPVKLAYEITCDGKRWVFRIE